MADPLNIAPPPLDLSTAARLKSQTAGAATMADIEAKSKKVAGEFEAMVIGQLLQPMFEAMDADGMFGGGSGERMFRPMLVEQYAKGMASAGGIGIADSVAREMMRLQTGAGTGVETVQSPEALSQSTMPKPAPEAAKDKSDGDRR